MGGRLVLGVHKATLQTAGRETGDTVDVTMELDTEPQGEGSVSRGTTVAPVEVERPVGDEVHEPDLPWIVIVWNDPINLMTYVTWVFMRLFGYPREKAEKLMWDVHTKGRAVVSSGPPREGRVGRGAAPRPRPVGHASRRSRDVAPFRRRKGRFSVTLGSRERELLSELCRQTRELLEAEDPSSDPSVARLFPGGLQGRPPAQPRVRDEPRGRAEERQARGDRDDGADAGREGALRGGAPAVDRGGERLPAAAGDEDRDHRGGDGTDFPDGDPNHDAFQVYVYLTWLEDRMLRALGAPRPGV